MCAHTYLCCMHSCSGTGSDMAQKEVSLQRTVDISGHLGGFGFSVLGGAGTKFPAVVCEVDKGGPAALSGKVSFVTSSLEWEGKGGGGAHVGVVYMCY